MSWACLGQVGERRALVPEPISQSLMNPISKLKLVSLIAVYNELTGL